MRSGCRAPLARAPVGGVETDSAWLGLSGVNKGSKAVVLKSWMARVGLFPESR